MQKIINLHRNDAGSDDDRNIICYQVYRRASSSISS